MKKLLLLLLPLVFLQAAPAQTAPSDENSTVITSDLFRLDQAKHQGFFTGSVLVVSKDFRMTARELTVYFTPPPTPGEATPANPNASKVERLIAKGDVNIETGDRTAVGAQADYTVATDKMVLTGSPKVTQGKDVVTGTTITLYRTANRMDVDGRSRVVLTGVDGALAPSNAPVKPVQ